MFPFHDKAGRRLWTCSVERPGASQAAAVDSLVVGRDGTIYAGADEGRSCAIRPDGSQLSFPEFAQKLMLPTRNGPIYVATSGGVIAYGADGARVWSWQRPGDSWASVTTLALGTHGIVYAGVAGVRVDGIYALDTAGTNLWSAPAQSSPKFLAIGNDETLFVGSASRVDGSPAFVEAFGSDGSKLWTLPIGRWETRWLNGLCAGPAGAIYVCCSDPEHLLCALDSQAKVVWRAGLDSAPQTLSVAADGTIVVAERQNVSAFTAEGVRLWSARPKPALIGNGGLPRGVNPALRKLVDGDLQCIALGRDGTVFVGTGGYDSDPSFVAAFDPSGAQTWSYNLPSGTTALAAGPDGVVYAGTYDLRVYALTH
jgi:PQQ-like domain